MVDGSEAIVAYICLGSGACIVLMSLILVIQREKEPIRSMWPGKIARSSVVFGLLTCGVAAAIWFNESQDYGVLLQEIAFVIIHLLLLELTVLISIARRDQIRKMAMSEQSQVNHSCSHRKSSTFSATSGSKFAKSIANIHTDEIKTASEAGHQAQATLRIKKPAVTRKRHHPQAKDKVSLWNWRLIGIVLIIVSPLIVFFATRNSIFNLVAALSALRNLFCAGLGTYVMFLIYPQQVLMDTAFTAICGSLYSSAFVCLCIMSLGGLPYSNPIPYLIVSCVAAWMLLLGPLYSAKVIANRMKSAGAGVELMDVSVAVFISFIRTPAGFEAFKGHLVEEFSVENLLFWAHVEEYNDLVQLRSMGAVERRCTPESILCDEEIKTAALNIYADFIVQEAPLAITVPDPIFRYYETIFSPAMDEFKVGEVQSAINRLKIVQAGIFGKAQDTVIKLMATDSFFRFKKTTLGAAAWQDYTQPKSTLRKRLSEKVASKALSIVRSASEKLVGSSRRLSPKGSVRKRPFPTNEIVHTSLSAIQSVGRTLEAGTTERDAIDTPDDPSKMESSSRASGAIERDIVRDATARDVKIDVPISTTTPGATGLPSGN